ncbi:hypothetical protein Tco_0528875 [Tanacetum coccineum]
MIWNDTWSFVIGRSEGIIVGSPRLENPHQDKLENKEITETFPLETLGSVALRVDSTPWFADFANYHAGNFIVKGMSPYDLEDLCACFQFSNHAVSDHLHHCDGGHVNYHSMGDFWTWISKKRTKNEAKTTKQDTEWKSVERTSQDETQSTKATPTNP